MLGDLCPELLSYIMILGVTTQERDREETLTEANHIPLPFQILVCHVNSTLRYIALSTPALWTSICITNYPHINSQPQRLLTYTQTYLERSCNKPLQLRIDLRCHRDNGEKRVLPSDDERQIWSQILELVMEQSPRWERLSLGAECNWVEIVLESIMKWLTADGPMETLTYMSLVLDYHEGLTCQLPLPPPPSQYNFAKVLLNHAHKLVFLRLRGLAIYVVDRRFPSSLKVLHLDQTIKIPFTRASIYTITQHCPSLQHLSMHGDIDPGDGTPLPSPDTSYPILLFPELLSLRICGIGGLVYQVLLSADTPKLTSLMLKDIRECDLDTLQQHPFNSRAYPTLQGSSNIHLGENPPIFSHLRLLSIRNSELSPIAYKHIFTILPTLTNFTSILSIKTDRASMLYNDISGDIPWPHLRSLTLVFDANMAEARKTTKRIINERRRLGYPLCQVRMGITDVEDVLGEDNGDTEIAKDRDNVVIEEWNDRQETWPAGRLCLDEHDVLF